jgi:hypothetical protein
MANLTPSEKTKIRMYLGYPSNWRYKHPRLEGVLENDIDDDVAAEIRAALANVADLDAKIASDGISSAGIKRVEDIEFFASGRVSIELRQWGKFYVNRISILLGVPIYSDYFGSSGYYGDRFSAGGLANPGSGRSGPIPLG